MNSEGAGQGLGRHTESVLGSGRWGRVSSEAKKREANLENSSSSWFRRAGRESADRRLSLWRQRCGCYSGGDGQAGSVRADACFREQAVFATWAAVEGGRGWPIVMLETPPKTKNGAHFSMFPASKSHFGNHVNNPRVLSVVLEQYCNLPRMRKMLLAVAAQCSAGSSLGETTQLSKI